MKKKGSNGSSKQLSEAEKWRLLNVHLNDKIFKLEAQIANTESQLAGVKLENTKLKKELAELNDVSPFFEELGISRGDNIELDDKGTLTIKNRQFSEKKAVNEAASEDSQ